MSLPFSMALSGDRNDKYLNKACALNALQPSIRTNRNKRYRRLTSWFQTRFQRFLKSSEFCCLEAIYNAARCRNNYKIIHSRVFCQFLAARLILWEIFACEGVHVGVHEKRLPNGSYVNEW